MRGKLSIRCGAVGAVWAKATAPVEAESRKAANNLLFVNIKPPNLICYKRGKTKILFLVT
jgi:hypothetical protein